MPHTLGHHAIQCYSFRNLPAWPCPTLAIKMPVPNTESKNTRNPKPRNASVTATGTSNHAMDGIRTTPTLTGLTLSAKNGHDIFSRWIKIGVDGFSGNGV